MKTLVALVMAVLSCGVLAAELRNFDFAPDTAPQAKPQAKPQCGFSNLKLPKDFAVFAAGAYSGRRLTFQIDQSGHDATQIDVAVNYTAKPVVLLLGAYEPTVWNIGWSQGTTIVAVYASGYHAQAIAGVDKATAKLVSTYENHGPCGYFYINEQGTGVSNALSRSLFGRPIDTVYPAKNGKVVVGDALAPATRLLTSADTPPESFINKSAPLAGRAGVADAVRKGLLRPATMTDAEAWSDAVFRNNPARDVPPVAGQGIPRPPRPSIGEAYVVLGRFTYPAGLYGGNSVTFFIPKGVPKPDGDPGHSAVYDFNTLRCQGPGC